MFYGPPIDSVCVYERANSGIEISDQEEDGEKLVSLMSLRRLAALGLNKNTSFRLDRNVFVTLLLARWIGSDPLGRSGQGLRR